MKSAVKNSASITVYFTLALAMTAALILTLAEAARFRGLNADAEEWTKLTVESLFAGYQPVLLAEYDMFYLDGDFGQKELSIAQGKAEMEALLYDNVQMTEAIDGVNLYRMQPNQVEVLEYALATDQNGAVFEAQAADVMKSKLGEKEAKKILERILQMKEGQDDGEDLQRKITAAENALKEIKEQQENDADLNLTFDGKGAAQGNVQSEVSIEVSAEAVNPMEEINSMQKQGIMALVLPKETAVSGKNINIDNCLLKRKCEVGTSKKAVTNGWYERILMQEYLKEYGGNFCRPGTNEVLSYGEEYLICGKSGDSENLEGVVKKILLLRGIANDLYLQSDTVKQAEALTAATALAGASVNPAVIELVKQGILAAWAYAESIYDVKTLLAGGKIPLIKTAADWHTTLSDLKNASTAETQTAGSGFGYEEYLDVLLYAKTVKQLSYRYMDLMEHRMQQEENFVESRMDHMIVNMQIQAEYHADTIFSGIFTQDTIGGYYFLKKADYKYR